MLEQHDVLMWVCMLAANHLLVHPDGMKETTKAGRNRSGAILCTFAALNAALV
jgi:hypothetical protein